MRTQYLLFAPFLSLLSLASILGAAACSRTESVVAAANGSTERYILLVGAAKTQDGNCSNSAPDPNTAYTNSTTGDTKTELLATIYQTDAKTYLLSVVENYYTLSVPTIPVLSGTKTDTGYAFTGTLTNSAVGPGTATPSTESEKYTYWVNIAAGSNKNFDNVSGTMGSTHTESCTGPACNPNAYLADCKQTSTFSGVRLTNVITTVGP